MFIKLIFITFPPEPLIAKVGNLCKKENMPSVSATGWGLYEHNKPQGIFYKIISSYAFNWFEVGPQGKFFMI